MTAAAGPLYGTWTSCTPAAVFNISAPICKGEPLPAEP